MKRKGEDPGNSAKKKKTVCGEVSARICSHESQEASSKEVSLQILYDRLQCRTHGKTDITKHQLMIKHKVGHAKFSGIQARLTVLQVAINLPEFVEMGVKKWSGDQFQQNDCDVQLTHAYLDSQVIILLTLRYDQAPVELLFGLCIL